MAPNANRIPWLAPYLQCWSTINYSAWPSAVLQGVVGNMLLSLIRKNQCPSNFGKLLLLRKYSWNQEALDKMRDPNPFLLENMACSVFRQ